MYYYSFFRQLFKFVSQYRFEESVEKLSGDRFCKHFTVIRHGSVTSRTQKRSLMRTRRKQRGGWELTYSKTRGRKESKHGSFHFSTVF